MITVTSQYENALGSTEDKHWRPTPKQSKFLRLPYEIDEAGYGGALMAGKTDVLLLMPLIYQLYLDAKYKGIFFRRTFPELESEVIPRSHEFFPSSGATYNSSKHRWEWPNGALDMFAHAKDEKDIRKYDTLQACCARWDEATHFTSFQYEYFTLRRVRAPVGYKAANGRVFTRWGSNPGNIGHAYFRKRFIDPFRDGGKLIRDAKTGSLRIFIPATARDNPHAMEANPKYFAKLQEISSEAERRAMIYGDWYSFEGQVFDFRLEPLSDEPPNACHVCAPFKVPLWWPKLISIDWGERAYTFIMWWAISPEGRCYVYRCYAIKKAKIKQWVRDMILLSGDEIDNVRDVRICHSAVQDVGQDQTLFQQVAEAMEEANFKCSLTKGERNRVAGKQLVHEYLRWAPLPSVKNVIGEYDEELARRIERMHGSVGLSQYVKYFEPEKEEPNLPKLQIFTHDFDNNDDINKAFGLLTEAISVCVYDDTRKEDVKEFDGDDPYDCLRIGLYAVRDYFDESRTEFARQEKMGLASKHLAKTGDQTSFYRFCENLERGEKDNYSVRRKGRRSSRMSRVHG